MFCGGYFLCPTMLSTAHSLLCRAYFEGKMNGKSLNYLYPIEREIYALMEPSQLASITVPLHLTDLIEKLYTLLDDQCCIVDVFPQYKNVFKIAYSYIQPLEIRGDIPYTIYVDMHNDTHEYIIKRLQYYTGAPNIELRCDGKVVYIQPGGLFNYTIPYSSLSRLSYVIVPENDSNCEVEPTTPSLLGEPLAIENALRGTEPPAFADALRDKPPRASGESPSASQAYVPLPPPRLNLSGDYRAYLPSDFEIIQSPYMPNARFSSRVCIPRKTVEKEIEFAPDEHTIDYEELD